MHCDWKWGKFWVFFITLDCYTSWLALFGLIGAEIIVIFSRKSMHCDCKGKFSGFLRIFLVGCFRLFSIMPCVHHAVCVYAPEKIAFFARKFMHWAWKLDFFVIYIYICCSSLLCIMLALFCFNQPIWNVCIFFQGIHASWLKRVIFVFL